VSILDGDKQSGRVGEPLALPLLIQVSDSRGEPVAGATVAFEFSSAGPGAAVVPEQKTTNSAGQADAQLVLGTTVGPQAGQVRVVAPAPMGEPVQASFSAMALSENANSMAAAGGLDQTGHVLRPLDDRLVVEVTDGFGNPVAGVPITWAAAGGGSVSADVVPTDEDGRSRVERILGPTVGQQTTLASSEGLAGSPVVFVHTAIAGDASRLTIVSGDDQTGAVGTLLPAELVVRLIDSEGNGVPNTAVTWVPAIGGGAPNPQNTTTDNDGHTSTQWTLGPALGGQRMDAVVSGVGVASFTATATAGAPASLLIRTQPSSSARNGIPFERQPVVQLRDPQGNDVAAAGVQVTVSLNGGGELEGTTRRTTDASGRVTFDDLAISGAPGTRTLTFEALGYAPVTSAQIAVSAIGTTTTITGDSPDPSQVGTPFTVSFRVTSEGPTPTGSVTVGDGAQSCTGALSNGAGSCQLTLSTAGQRTLTATYAGALGLSGSSDSEPHTVTAAPPPPPAATTTNITADSPDPSESGRSVTVSVRVTSGAGTPTGNVTVSVSGGTTTCTITLSGGEGSCPMTLDGVGPRTFTATYQGAPGFAASSDTEDHTVTAQPPPPPPLNNPPDADYDWTCDGLTCQFTDASRDGDGAVVGWRWDFGDGGSSTEASPSHTFAAAGTYSVTLTATDDDGAFDSRTTRVRVEAPPPANQPPTAAFTADCDELECDFDNESDDPDGRITSSVWDFGDGRTSNDRNPDHEYGASGTYTVMLTVTDNDGASGSTTQQVTVAAAPPPNQSPSASFTESCSGLTCSFNSAGSSDPDGSIVGYSWTFGDGTASTEANPGHTYSAGGTYTVTLQVRDDDNATDEEARQVTVTAPPPPNQAPTAAFSESCSDLTCSFDSSGSGDSDGTITYSWNFGDNGTSNDANPAHTYAEAGTYTVTLTVTDDDGATSQASHSVTAQSPAPQDQAPTAVIGSISCTGMTCTFTDASTDPDGNETINQWNWVFGDGASSTERNPVHAYSTPDEYDVELRVTDDGGLSGTDSERVTAAVEDGGDVEG
jgi:PKD repeat protein